MTETSTAGPAPTPFPDTRKKGDENKKSEETNNPHDGDDPEDKFSQPKLRLQIHDITHPGAARFLSAVDASTILSQCVETVLRLLYISNRHESYTPPPTRSVTVILEDTELLAYTIGLNLDNDHKEIHVSLRYIDEIKEAPDGSDGDRTGAYEIQGVLVHELVHCFQHTGKGRSPVGLIEGIADWVRLKAKLAPSHWNRSRVPDKWDAGYENTAYFLDWIEENFGTGTVRKMNEDLRTQEYKESEFWKRVVKRDIDDLWKEYLRVLKKE